MVHSVPTPQVQASHQQDDASKPTEFTPLITPSTETRGTEKWKPGPGFIWIEIGEQMSPSPSNAHKLTK